MAAKNQLTGLMQRESVAGMSKESFMLRDVVFWASFFLAWLCLALPFLRYFCFFIPFFVLVCVLGERRAAFGGEIRAFAWYAVFGIAMYPLATSDGLKDFFLALSGVSIALMPDMPKPKLSTILIWLLVGFVIYFGLGGAFTRHIEFSFANSYSTFESNFAFEFALLVPFALYQRRWYTFLVAAVFAVLTLKRIALLGAVLCCLLQLIKPSIGKKLLSPPVMVIFNVCVLGMTMAYSMGYFDLIIHDLTGQSANQLGQGRRVLQQLPSKEIFERPWEFILYGDGPGQAYVVAAIGASAYTKASLHSDLLKLLYEHGLLFFCVFIWLLYSVPTYIERIGMLYLNILFMTDNTMTYYFFLFFFVVCSRTQCLPEMIVNARANLDKHLPRREQHGGFA